jgi:hypothetical protein
MRRALPVAAAAGRHLARLALLPAVLGAQARLSGTVLAGDTREAVAGAVVAVPALARRVTTDAAGRFDLDGIPGGELFLLVRAIGYRPDTTLLAFGASEVRVQDIVLDRAVTALEEVRVRARRPEFRGRPAEFEERRLLGIGRFLDTTVFDAQRGRRTADIVGSSAAGLHIVRDGSSAALSTHRVATREALSRAGGRCWLDVWLDGVPVAQGTRFDINSITPETIAGMELYVGPAQVPVRFNRSGAVCGVAVIWTR